MSTFEENYVIDGYIMFTREVMKYAYAARMYLYKDTEYTFVEVAYNFDSEDKKLLEDYRETLVLIIVQFFPYFDLSKSKESKLHSKEEFKNNLKYILNRFTEKQKIAYTQIDYEMFINDINESIKLVRREKKEDDDFFEIDFINNFEEWYEDTIKEVVKNNFYYTNVMLSKVSDYYDYCYYKDLEGMYCEKCKNWLVYRNKADESDDSDWYIISDDLIPCPDCVKTRNGKYRWLSDFSLIRHKWLQNPKPYWCRDFIEAIRTPFLKKVYTGYHEPISHKPLTRKYISKWSNVYKFPFEHEILSNKVKRDINKIYEGPRKEIVVYHVYVVGLYYTPEIYKLFKDSREYNLWYKFIIINGLGSKEDKNNFYNRMMNDHDLFKNLNYTFNKFYEHGYCILEQEHRNVKFEKLSALGYNSKKIRKFELLMLEDGDPYELTQLYVTNSLYTMP